MSFSDSCVTGMPEWYRTEKDTAKIIEKLGSVKELDFYLRNPDEYIRRLAILRLYKISDKESIFVLKELLDDPVESDDNKYLAAWILKSFSKKWVSDFFSNNRYLNKFSGNESFDELFSIKTDLASSDVDFDFKGSPSYSLLNLDSDESTLQRDIFFETEFDFKNWFASFGSLLKKAFLNLICTIPSFLIKLPGIIYKIVYSKSKQFSQQHDAKKQARIQLREEKIKERGNLHEAVAAPIAANPAISLGKEKHEKKREKAIRHHPIRTHERKANSERLYRNDTDYSYKSLRDELYRKPSFFSRIKKGVFQMLYVLFFPIRFALKHKLAVLCTILLTYSLLAFTNYGRAFTNKYWNIDLRVIQHDTVQKIKEYSNYAINEFNRITGINEWRAKQANTEPTSSDTLIASNISDSSESAKLYTVTAKKGLNVRKLPDAASEKVGADSLAFGSIVTYLSKSKKDDSGIVWYYIKAADGRIGWASAAFLKENKEG
ncbi:MAG: SH3 domain-containing protein [Clostridiaceae bacterium]